MWEWLKLGNPPEAAGPVAERLRVKLGLSAEDAAPPNLRPGS